MFKRMLVFAMLVAVCLTLFVPVSAQETDQAVEEVYLFDFTETDIRVDRKIPRGKSLVDKHLQRELKVYYDAQELNWIYALKNTDLMETGTTSVNSVFYFGNTDAYKWTGLRLGVVSNTDGKKQYPAGYWMSITIRVPQSGVYQVSLDYMTRADGTLAGQVYILDGVYVDELALDRDLKEAEPVGTVDFFKHTWDIEPATAVLGEVALEAGENTVVFRADQKDGNDVSAYMYINALHLSNQGMQERARQVDALILAIGNVTKDSGEAISRARAAYDQLDASAASYVENLSILTAAESAYARQGSTDTLVVSVCAGVVAVCVLAGAAIIWAAKRKKPDKA